VQQLPLLLAGAQLFVNCWFADSDIEAAAAAVVDIAAAAAAAVDKLLVVGTVEAEPALHNCIGSAAVAAEPTDFHSRSYYLAGWWSPQYHRCYFQIDNASTF